MCQPTSEDKRHNLPTYLSIAIVQKEACFLKEGRQTLVQTAMYTDHTRRQHVVEVLKESLVFDLLVGEDEGDSLAFLAGRAVQVLEVVQQVGYIVGPEETPSQNAQHSFLNTPFLNAPFPSLKHSS